MQSLLVRKTVTRWVPAVGNVCSAAAAGSTEAASVRHLGRRIAQDEAAVVATVDQIKV